MYGVFIRLLKGLRRLEVKKLIKFAVRGEAFGRMRREERFALGLRPEHAACRPPT